MATTSASGEKRFDELVACIDSGEKRGVDPLPCAFSWRPAEQRRSALRRAPQGAGRGRRLLLHHLYAASLPVRPRGAPARRAARPLSCAASRQRPGSPAHCDCVVFGWVLVRLPAVARCAPVNDLRRRGSARTFGRACFCVPGDPPLRQAICGLSGPDLRCAARRPLLLAPQYAWGMAATAFGEPGSLEYHVLYCRKGARRPGDAPVHFPAAPTAAAAPAENPMHEHMDREDYLLRSEL